MPKYNGSYAYDVPHYFDFVVEAATQEEADTLIQKALVNGVFSDRSGNPCYESWDQEGDRVFVSGEVSDEHAQIQPLLTDKGLVEPT